MGPTAPERVTQPVTVGDRLQRQPSPRAATAFQPTTNNKRHVFNPPQNGHAVKGPPPRADQLGRSLLWMVHVEAAPLRVPPAFGRCQSGAGEPRWLGKLWVSPCRIASLLLGLLGCRELESRVGGSSGL